MFHDIPGDSAATSVRVKQLEAELASLHEAAASAVQLREENKQLRLSLSTRIDHDGAETSTKGWESSRVVQITDNHSLQSLRAPVKEPVRNFSPFNGCTLQQENEQLRRTLETVSQRLEDTVAAHKRLVEKYKGEKTTIKAWIRYHERHKHKHLRESADRKGWAHSGGEEANDVHGAIAREHSKSSAHDHDIHDRGHLLDERKENKTSKETDVERRITPASAVSPQKEREDSSRALSGGRLLPITTPGTYGHATGEVKGRIREREKDLLTKGSTADVEDLPVIISERPAKRKRRQNLPQSAAIAYTTFRASKLPEPANLKQELSPSLTGRSRRMDQQSAMSQSIDLDEAGPRLDTPRKRRTMREIIQLSQQRSIVTPIALEWSSDGPDLVGIRCITERPRRAWPDSISHRSIQRSLSEPLIDAASPSPLPKPPALDSSRTKSVALSTTTEIKKVSRIDELASELQHLRSEKPDNVREALGRMMGEDDEGYAAQERDVINISDAILNSSEDSDAKKESKLPSSQRLVSLLESQPNREGRQPLGRIPRNPLACAQMTTRIHDASQAGGYTAAAKRSSTELWDIRPPISSRSMQLETLGEVDTPIPNIARTKVNARCSDDELLASVDAHARDLSKSEPFRARPPQRLSLENFKVNTDYNQGQSYAFTETVRERQKRKCLPGCTRNDCCGQKFRRLIELGGLPVSTSPALRWHSSQEDNEVMLLHEYLGDDSSHLASLSKDAREELLLRAQTKRFADMYGRHRHAYERHSTPPGFWRTDMPTTQELQADRDEAQQRDRLQVEERYRDAMRGGARWKFRDE